MASQPIPSPIVCDMTNAPDTLDERLADSHLGGAPSTARAGTAVPV